MKMLKAQLRHLPLDFNTAYKLYQFHYCDAANCLIPSSIIADNPIEILACDHTYHKSCYSNNGFKYLHCLLFLYNSIDEHVQSLLQSLQKLKEQVVEPENNISCDDNDDESESIKYVAYVLEEVLRKFQQQ
ncbi:12072_t:CDS:1 [Funneliformis caledonium]|uniref:12072_t:CDS:1 n=1 Tax=Funneliformis caledonium TaxID=1117310 RepID=A0A9N8Z5U1_9GLOM|nr:12072_t:CDS:1 [Funneliformis caledonium]